MREKEEEREREREREVEGVRVRERDIYLNTYKRVLCGPIRDKKCPINLHISNYDRSNSTNNIRY
jgi:hypothetical protein